MKKMFLFVSILVAVAMLLSACGAVATTAAPVATQPPATQPPATQPPAPTATQAPTAVPPTATQAPTVVPTPIPPVCNPLPDAMPAPASGQLGASDTPITMAFVPSGESGVIATASQAIADCLNKMTGLSYTIQTGTSYAAAIEAMGAGKAQVGFLNTFSILAAQAKYGIIPALINLRNYSTNSLDPDQALGGKLEPFYRGQFIANVASGIKTFADLKGKTFCFVDPLSTSGYIVPRIVLLANGINPDTDFKATQNAGSHPNVAIAVYKGDCDAGVTYINVLTDAATNLQGTYPDILTKVTVFADTARIPNDGVQYIKTFPAKLQAITTEGLLAMAQDPGGKAVLAKLYAVNAFQKIDSSFTMYADFLAVLKKAGVDPASLIK
ncbi:MAG: phosphate/phosphite/phosphonate ABC transporter substrate-binding protein [Anaerolineales bacterium]|jgi:phosphonate transport system substrate-binding protein